jgi:LDH2 family malate/lactate/ureidoglycolate dehydrogenase
VGAPATISLPQLRAFCRDAFDRADLSGPDAGTGAEVLSTTDAWGIFTHGSKALMSFAPGRGAEDRRGRKPGYSGGWK